jgi:basic membrane lipoprotein Med (substrate-binding protein (PBP1-ABC) superfamily)
MIMYGVTLAGAAVAGILLVAHHGGPTPAARQYLAFDACLLTGSRGLAGPQAAQAWTGMQNASLATRAKVEYLEAMGPQTTAAALPYVTSLVQRNCDMIIAVGQAPVSAVSSDAGRYPNVHFVVVGGAQAVNVTDVTTASSQITPAISRLVTSAVHASGA